MEIQVIYDNHTSDPQYKNGWGFSALVQTETRSVLFDTGEEPAILFHNLAALEIDPEDIDIIVISHEHRDHFGALEKLLIKNDNVAVYIPRSMSDRFKDYFRTVCSIVMEVSKPTRIADGIYCTGDCDDDVNEQSLVVETDDGLAVLVGCAHPGLKSILECSQQIVDAPIKLVLGGYHLPDADSKILEAVRILKQFHVETIAPGHCTTDRAHKILSKAFGEQYATVAVGTRFSF